MKLAVALVWIVLLVAGTSGFARVAFEADGTPQGPGPITLGLLREDFIGATVGILGCRSESPGRWGPAQSVSISDSGGNAD
jgi:hypothetical protein